MCKNYRDYLALFLGVLVFPGMWAAQGLGLLSLPGEVVGATIAIETLIGQFYFRKATTEG